MEIYDFSGWATRNDLICADGRIIRHNAFKDNDGKTVPLIWNHDHNNQEAVLGNATLENRDEGVYAYCKFNDSEAGRHAKELVKHGDVRSLSICANKLKQIGSDVIQGTIRELSLVLAGANPGAYIDTVMAHGDEEEDSIIVNYDENAITIYHSDDTDTSESSEENTDSSEESETSDSQNVSESEETTVEEETNSDDELAHSESQEGETAPKEKTVEQVYNEMSDEQKNVVAVMVGMALANNADEDDNENSEGGNDSMKHNVFDQEENKGSVLTHADQTEILKMAKSSQVGSFQAALTKYAEDNELTHAAAPVGGFKATGAEGELTIDALFPEYKDLKTGAPELITNDQGWISVVLNKVHKSPISRIRTGQVDIRNIDALRAKGYKKGEEKAYTGNFKLVRRTTDPQTIYVKNALHRDDIIDITDFDYVSYLYNIDKMMLNEELATAIMFGDGREDGDEAKISPEHIRPIWLDDDLYSLHVTLDVDAVKAEIQGSETGSYFGDGFVRAEALITKVLYARENYKGSGTPDCFIHPHELNVMLLARDRNGHRMYSSKAELAAALNVGNIYTVEQMAGKTRKTSDGKTMKPLCIIANLSDYSLGATKGGEVTHFTQFDIDFNQQKSLLETRCSGALTKVYSAIVVEEEVAAG